MDAKLAEGNIFMFIKFKDNKDHLVSLQKGILYMNNGKYFRDLEKTSGILGIGDKYELSQVISNVSFRMINPETDETILVGDAASVSFSFDAHMAMPIFCLTQIDSNSLKIVQEYEDSVDCILDFGENDIDKIIKDFGEYALIISPGEFIKKLDNATAKQRLFHYKGKVIYEDYSINSGKRLRAQHDHDPAYFFYKRIDLAHQREYRIVLPNIESEGPYMLDIGDLSNVSYLIETRKLFSGDFRLNLSRE